MSKKENKFNQEKLDQYLNFSKKLDEIEAKFPMFQILDEEGQVTDEELVPALTDEQFVEIMGKMLFSRTLHNEMMSYSLQARIGFYAPTLGQEAAQIASSYVFEKDDWLFGSYRDIPQLIEHGASVSEAILWSKGHVEGGNFHETKQVKAAVPQIIIGAQMIQANGNALGQKLRNSSQVTFAYIGDGGSSQGDTYEGLNFAGRYQTPVVFFVQNNGYAISTPVEKQTAAKSLAQKAVAAGIPSIQVDGMDPLAVYTVAKAAREYAADGKGPIVVEMVTSRMGPHSLSGDDPERYRDEASFDFWEKRDPIERYRKFLADRDLFTSEKEEQVIEEAKVTISEGMELAESKPEMIVSESLKWQYQNPTSDVLEQIEIYADRERDE